MDDELRRLIAEVDSWGDYQIRLFSQGKEGIPEYEHVIERWLVADRALGEYAAKSPPTVREAERAPPQAPPTAETLNCDVRHKFPRGLGPCKRCGAANPWMSKVSKKKVDPAVALYKDERARRPAVIGGASRQPLVAVSRGRRMQAVWEAQ